MCIYCRIASGELPASVVYEDEQAMAFLDIQPINPGHVLVIPKQHASNLVDLSADDAAHLMRVGQTIAKAFHWSDLKCEGRKYFSCRWQGRGTGCRAYSFTRFSTFPGGRL